MRVRTARARASSAKILLGVAASFFILALVVIRLQGGLNTSFVRLNEEYLIDRDLDRHKEERTNLYGEVLKNLSFPESGPLDATHWIQWVQEKLAAQNLSLKELRPVDMEDTRKANLVVVVECDIRNLIGFLYDLAQSDHLTYVDKLSASPAFEGSSVLEVQMRLKQYAEGL